MGDDVKIFILEWIGIDNVDAYMEVARLYHIARRSNGLE